MRRLATQFYPLLCTVLLVLTLLLVGLQQTFADHSTTQQSHALHEQMHSQQVQNSLAGSNCATDCAGTVHHCCLYALCASLPLAIYQPNPIQYTVLPSLFRSRATTPVTPPPKSVLS